MPHLLRKSLWNDTLETRHHRYTLSRSFDTSISGRACNKSASTLRFITRSFQPRSITPIFREYSRISSTFRQWRNPINLEMGGGIFKRRLFPRRRLFRYSTRYGQLSLHARQLGCYSPYRGKGGGTRVEIDSPRSFCGRTRVETRVDKELRLCCAGLDLVHQARSIILKK